MADRSSLRNFLSFASAVAYSVALAALSFSTCDFVRLNTRNPFICFLFRYLLSVRPNVRGEDGPLGGSVRYCRSFSAAERVHGLADHPNRVRGRGYGVRSTIAEVRLVGIPPTGVVSSRTYRGSGTCNSPQNPAFSCWR